MCEDCWVMTGGQTVWSRNLWRFNYVTTCWSVRRYCDFGENGRFSAGKRTACGQGCVSDTAHAGLRSNQHLDWSCPPQSPREALTPAGSPAPFCELSLWKKYRIYNDQQQYWCVGTRIYRQDLRHLNTNSIQVLNIFAHELSKQEEILYWPWGCL